MKKHFFPVKTIVGMMAERCESPIAFYKQSNILFLSVFCKDGHHVRTKMFETEKRLHDVARRLERLGLKCL